MPFCQSLDLPPPQIIKACKTVPEPESAVANLDIDGFSE